MKTDNDNMDLQELLASLEHAGRDERRRQELGDMIDRMAAAESRRHGFWWWGGRVAAAACIFFFISTAVRIWFIPTGDAVQVARTEVSPMPEVPAAAPSPAAVREVQVAPSPCVRRERPVKVAEEVVEKQSVEELLVEEVAVPKVEEPCDTAVAPTVIIEDDVAPNTDWVAEAVPEEPAAAALPQDEPAAEPEKLTIGSIFKSLFRLAEPSAMDGTTLALLEF